MIGFLPFHVSQNRLLEMIRHQQAQLQAIQQQASYTPLSSSTATNDITPPSERSTNNSYPYAVPSNRQSANRSRTPSRTASPSQRPVSAGMQGLGDDWSFVGRSQSSFDDSTFYQAETQNLTRENQMLKQRIKELGKSTRGFYPVCYDTHDEQNVNLMKVTWLLPTARPPPPI